MAVCSESHTEHINTPCGQKAEACNTSTTQNEPHQISNRQQTEKKGTDVVIQQHSRKLLVMDILMSEICCAHKKWNRISSDMKLVFHSSAIIKTFFKSCGGYMERITGTENKDQQ